MWQAANEAGLYISHLPTLTIMDDFIATISDRVIPPSTVSMSAHSDRVLEIDVEEAWRSVEAPVGWGNEVDVNVYFT
ncbi:hypothetical protein IMZ48_07835, partial [Candidatus Bathyarchaeota archaeon]|nr:hypothetical protein [Candidatus Bathyarchaeota archaeon]